MEKNVRRKKATKALLVVVALLLAILLISSTFARYSTVGKADGKVDIAKWAVKMTADDGTTLDSTTKNITFKVQNNTNVVPGKIAPAVTAVAKIELDLTGTEVAVDFKAEVGDLTPTNLPSSDKISLTSAVGGGTPGTFQTIPLVNNAAFTTENGKKIVTLTLTWENDDNNNADDTSTGITGGTLTVPVTMTVQQHIGA